MLLDVLNFLPTFLRNSNSTKLRIVPYTYVEINKKKKKKKKINTMRQSRVKMLKN